MSRHAPLGATTAGGGAVPRPSSLSLRNRLGRAIWTVVYTLLFRPSPRALYAWRRFLLRLFGARIDRQAVVHASVRIFAPWNLEMAAGACLSHFVDCYCVDRVTVGRNAVVSQYSFLCTASHDHSRREMPLTHRPIEICEDAWVAADVFVAPGVSVGPGAVVQARSVVLADVPPWMVVGGHPARPIKARRLSGGGADPV